MGRSLLLLVMLAASCANASATVVWYVNVAATGSNDGSDWDNAFTTLEQALVAAQPGDEVWMAAGEYSPTALAEAGEPRSATFQLPSGVAIYGGFAGTEAHREERNSAIHVTVLSGDLLHNDDGTAESKTDNAYHVCRRSTTGTAAVLDGLTIQGGGKQAGILYGAGLHHAAGTLTVVNCRFLSNQVYRFGGAIASITSDALVLDDCEFVGNNAYQCGGGALYGASCNIEVRNCTFRGNATNYGGAVALIGSNACRFTSCRFIDNLAMPYYGGAMYVAGFNSGNALHVDGCSFEGNRSKQYGGAVVMEYGSPTLDIRDSTFTGNRCIDLVKGGGAIYHRAGLLMLTGCVLEGNEALQGGALHNESSPAQIVNCRFDGNSSIGEGGAIYSHLATVSCGNAVMVRNDADAGAAVYNADSDVEMLNCTIANNIADVADSAAVVILDSASTHATHMANSITWGNTTSSGGGESAQIALGEGGSFSIDYSCVEGWTGTLGGSGNMGLDPQFAADGRFTELQSTSPCIDAANNALVAEDLNDVDGDGNLTEPVPTDAMGHPRLMNAPGAVDTGVGQAPIVDMGAAEYIEDCNSNGIFDACELSCGEAGGPCDVAGCGTAQDCDADATPDSCEPDTDHDAAIDDCDDDDDNDGVADAQDNCRLVANSDQANSDADALGDACDVCAGTIAGVAVDEQGCPPVLPADMDRDGDVDQTDFGAFQLCLTGSAMPQTNESCARALLDGDDDVDGEDTRVFIACLSGPGVPADPACAQ